MQRIFISLGLCSCIFTASAAISLEQQRETYLTVTRLLDTSQSKQTQEVAKVLLEDIREYPLYPYAEYQLLKADKDSLNFSNIEDYQRRYPYLKLSHELKKKWLEQLQEKKDWQTIIDHADKLPNDNASQCIILEAKAAIEKTTPNSTALLQQSLQKLWLTGNILPKQCDALLAQWQSQGGLNEELLLQRAVLALEQGNLNLLAQLPKYTANAALRNRLHSLSALAKTPRALWETTNPFNAEKLSPDNPLDKRILLAVYPHYLKTLNETELPDPEGLFQKEGIHGAIAQKFNLPTTQINQWKAILLTRIFDTESAALQQWRDKQLLIIADDNLLERRIRMAIREKNDISSWLNALSQEAKNKDEWRYWQAKAWQKQGKKAQAEQLLTAMLTAPRGFYPMLAAAELGKPYRPEMRELKNIILKRRKTQKQTIDTAQQYAPVLQRIAELRYFNDQSNINTEWKTLLDSVSFEQKLQLAQYAETQHWYDLQVEATIQAKAWQYIRLRLPNAYQDWFDLNLKDKKIERTFAMAIARQESAWKPYVVSSANARGLMQLLPGTAKLTAQRAKLPYENAEQLFEPFNNIMLGTAHLQELYERFGNNRILIASAYNAGPHRVEQWLKKAGGKLTMAEFVASIPFYETRGYVQNVLAYDTYYQILQEKKPQLFSKEEYNRLY